MKYKLLKDLPGLEAGAIFEVMGGSFLVHGNYKFPYSDHVGSDWFDWFAHIIERWEPKCGDIVYFINAFMEIDTTLDFSGLLHTSAIKFGNCFRTKEQAIEARDAIKKVLDDLHRQWGE